LTSFTFVFLTEDGEALADLVPMEPFAGSLSNNLSAERARWYAVRTSPRHEKRVRDHLNLRDLVCFLPLHQAVHRWKNGCKMQLDLPLFPSYLFVEIELSDRVRILEIPGVVSLLGTGPNYWPLPEGEVEALRDGLHLRKPEPHAYLTTGKRVRIKAGPLSGLTGIFLRRREEIRVVLSVEMLMQVVAVEVSIGEIESAD
jgi:transcription antitermination factor NusG